MFPSVLCDNADALLDEKTIIMFLKQSPRVLLDDHTFWIVHFFSWKKEMNVCIFRYIYLRQFIYARVLPSVIRDSILISSSFFRASVSLKKIRLFS